MTRRNLRSRTTPRKLPPLPSVSPASPAALTTRATESGTVDSPAPASAPKGADRQLEMFGHLPLSVERKLAADARRARRLAAKRGDPLRETTPEASHANGVTALPRPASGGLLDTAREVMAAKAGRPTGTSCGQRAEGTREAAE